MLKTGETVGPFQLLEQIGAGGMGVVFRARYEKTGQIVALKLLPDAAAEDEIQTQRFDRELAVLRKLRHPHIVHCYGGGRFRGQRFIAMELVEGGTLAQLLRQRGRLSWEETVTCGKAICEALAHAHAEGIIHRDLKPANLMLTKAGELKLTDFGLARDLDESRLTRTGKTLGTFAYMAPEQIRGFPALTHKVDLYALGCVLFELLAGRPPFTADQPAQVLYKQLDEMPPRVCELALDSPVWLEAVIASLLEKHPDKRPMDALAVLTALDEVEEKVRSGASVAGHAMSGQPTTLSMEVDQTAVKGLVARKKRRKKSDHHLPLLEQLRFQVACLVLLAAGVTWALWPMSAGTMFQKGDALWAGADRDDRLEARDRYFKPYLEKYPDGPHASVVQERLDELHMERVLDVMRTNARLGREPRSEAERLFLGASQYEQFGDTISAVERYRSMDELLASQADEDSRAFRNLARRRAAELQQGVDGIQDRRALVIASLQRAESLYREKHDLVEARKVWESITRLYSGNQELSPLVRIAAEKLREPDAPLKLETDSTSEPDGSSA